MINRPSNFGSPLYPSPTAGRGERIGKTPMMRCQHCGCPNNMNKTKVGKGDGNVRTETEITHGPDGSYVAPAEIEVESGCRFCGSNSPTPRKPKKWPEPENIPATDHDEDRG